MPSQYIKVCRSKRAFYNELYVYQSLFPNKAELVEIIKPHTLVLSKVDGIPYLDVPVLTETMVIKLAKTIAKLQAVTRIDDCVLCHWDNQPRNILWSEKQQKYYLVDFEDIRLAHPEADIAHLFLFWAEIMSNPEFERNINSFFVHYKSAVPINILRWQAELKKAIIRFDRRRKKYNKAEPIANNDKQINRKYLINTKQGLI